MTNDDQCVANRTLLLKSLAESIEKSRKACGIPGMAVAVLFKGELIFAEGFGIRNDQNEPFAPQTLSPIGSLTKAFTATTIGELVAEGKMDWGETPVNKYLPEFELQDSVWTRQLTISDLLSHRTGLPLAPFLFHRNQGDRREITKAYQNLVLPARRPLIPKYNYDNNMFIIAGEAAVSASGIKNIKLEDLVHLKVIDPLGLKNTGFSPMNMRKHAPKNHARAFYAKSLQDARDGKFQQEEFDENFFASAASGDMYSNVLDLVRWGKVVIEHGSVDDDRGELDVGQEGEKHKRRQVLNKKSVQETLTPKILVPAESTRTSEFPLTSAYGLGWGIGSYKGQAVYRHAGSISGFTSQISMYPDSDLVIAQVFNISTNELSPYVNYHIADLLLDLPLTQDWLGVEAVKKTEMKYAMEEKMSKTDLPKQILNKERFHSDLKAYVGEFVNPTAQEIIVRLEQGSDIDGKDTLSSSPKLIFKMWQVEKALIHYHYDSYVMDLTDMSIKGQVLITFQTGPLGKIDAIVLGPMRGGGSMLFKRKV
ncbi:hypothetical protein BGZ83_010411 [Gryganskiella cystojenkinii]|nr:hypothetical protein BGZ83_010411 [Gryganskiella cystojenkinii]